MPPLVTNTIEETRRALRNLRAEGRTVGLVPTMGALHAGHAALLRQAKLDNDIVAASIFVNPTQFGPSEDFQRYPRPLDADLHVCASAGVDLVFHPTPAEIYPPGFQSYVEVRNLQMPLCGGSRPLHFRGVATVVLKLVNIVQPDRAYFGQKDAQQARIIVQMTRDLDVPTQIVISPTVREPDGLAMSSRNRYLTPAERQHATVLYRSLEMIRQRIEAGARQAQPLIAEARRMIQATPGMLIDYVAIVDWEAFEPIEVLTGQVLVAEAVRCGTTRLIDNLRLDVAS